jgi:hypothetical protein
MSNQRNSFTKRTKQNKNKDSNKQRPNKNDNALLLRPEFKGQPAISLKVKGFPSILTTSVTSGQINSNIPVQATTLINSFTTRFQAFTEYRIVKCTAKLKNFSCSNPGLCNFWFTEDDTSTPTAAKALQAEAKQVNFADIVGNHKMTYVPHDPAQQTWTLVASGAPIVGYFKVFTDNANFGSTIIATTVGIIAYDLVVQFRGLI